MPGSPPSSPRYSIPRYSDADSASFSSQVNAITDGFDAGTEFKWTAFVHPLSALSDHGMGLVAGGVTATLPSAVVGRTVHYIADTSASGASPVTVARAGTDVINGLGLSGATAFPLGTPGAFARLYCFATGVWTIVEGERDSGWVPMTLNGGWWSPYTASFPGARYRLRGNTVTLDGAAQNVSGSPLPSGGTLASALPPPPTMHTFVFTELRFSGFESAFQAELSTGGNLVLGFIPGSSGGTGAVGVNVLLGLQGTYPVD